MKLTARLTCLSLLLAAVACAAESSAPAGTALPRHSPFLPAGGAPTAVTPAETLEFAGVSLVVGTKADLIFYDKTAKKTHWITEGETKDGIAVLSYDSRRQQAVVKLNGVEKVLPLRKGTGPLNAPAPVQPMPTGFNMPVTKIQPTSPPSGSVPGAFTPATAAAPVPAPATPPVAPKPEAPATPETQAKAETEARMLVSDLLEIGMAQRKAYEEAQRRAAEGNAQPAAAPNAAGTTPAAGTQPLPEKPNGN